MKTPSSWFGKACICTWTCCLAWFCLVGGRREKNANYEQGGGKKVRKWQIKLSAAYIKTCFMPQPHVLYCTYAAHKIKRHHTLLKFKKNNNS